MNSEYCAEIVADTLMTLGSPASNLPDSPKSMVSDNMVENTAPSSKLGQFVSNRQNEMPGFYGSSKFKLPSINELLSKSLPHEFHTGMNRNSFSPYWKPTEVSPRRKSIDAIYTQRSPMQLPARPQSSISYTQAHYSNLAHKTLRYDILKNGTPVARQCGDCEATHTSGHWCQDTQVVGGYICQKCYRRRKRSSAKHNIVTRSCHTCSTTTTKVWFKHHDLRQTYVCYDCHESQDYGLLGNKCHGCGSSKSTKWAVDPKGNMICRKCTRQLVNANTLDKVYLEDPTVPEQAKAKTAAGSGNQ